MTMSSRARNFRRRAHDDDDNNDNPNYVVTPSTTEKQPHKKAPKLLSFVDDEENAALSYSFSSKPEEKPCSGLGKPSSVHKMIALKHRIAHSSLPSNVKPQAGTYTIEVLRELQKNTRTLASSRPSSSEPTIVLDQDLELDSEDNEDQQEKERGSLFRMDKDGDEDEEEEKIWEEEQFSNSSVPVVESVQQHKPMHSAITGYSWVHGVPYRPSIGGAIGAAQGSNVMSIKEQAEIAKKSLRENVKKLKVWMQLYSNGNYNIAQA